MAKMTEFFTAIPFKKEKGLFLLLLIGADNRNDYHPGHNAKETGMGEIHQRKIAGILYIRGYCDDTGFYYYSITIRFFEIERENNRLLVFLFCDCQRTFCPSAHKLWILQNIRRNFKIVHNNILVGIDLELKGR